MHRNNFTIQQSTYHKVTRIEEGLIRLGSQNQQQSTQLTNSDGNYTYNYEESVPMTCNPQLPPDPHMLFEYHPCLRPTPFKQLVYPFKPKLLKLTCESEEHTHQQEDPSSVNPTHQHQHKHN